MADVQVDVSHILEYIIIDTCLSYQSYIPYCTSTHLNVTIVIANNDGTCPKECTYINKSIWNNGQSLHCCKGYDVSLDITYNSVYNMPYIRFRTNDHKYVFLHMNNILEHQN
jgi:hypothetical protein